MDADDGIYIPENMTRNTTNSHVFVMDNLDWRKKTLDGGSFHATTAIVIENTKNVTSQANKINIQIKLTSAGRQKT